MRYSYRKASFFVKKKEKTVSKEALSLIKSGTFA